MSDCKVYGIEFEGEIVYVGVTNQDIRQRISSHQSHSKNGHRGAKKFGEWLKKSPIFSVKILEYCSVKEKFEREMHWIEFYNTYEKLNSKPFSGALGRPKGCPNPSGKNHYAARSIRWKKTGEIFGSMPEAARAAGVSVATVCLHANGKRPVPQFEFIE